MADTKITALTAITTVDPAVDVLPIVDVSDTTMAASGTTKKITSNQILGSGGTATLASATITGDLTVDTSTLKVDSANNRVGVNTATPSYPLHVLTNAVSGRFNLSNIDRTTANWARITNPQYATDASAGLILRPFPDSDLRQGAGIIASGGTNNGDTNVALFVSSGIASSTSFAAYATTVSGSAVSHDWYQSAGSTAMTLNSTGLGVGGSPLDKFTVVGNSFLRGAAAGVRIGDGGGYGFISAYDQTISTPKDLVLQTGGGNVGIGVTPSAWASGNKFIDINSSAAFGAFGSSDAMMIGNAYWNGSSWIRKTANNAWRFVIESVSSTPTMTWQLAANGSAGSSITWTQAMTLTADGELLVGTASVGGVFDTKFYLSSNSGTNKWAVGPYGTATNFAIIPTPGTGGVYLSGTSATSWTAYSDERLKDIIEPITNALTKVGSLRSVIGKFKGDEANTRRPFLIAQDLQSALPEAVDASNPDRLGVAYTDVIPLLVAAIKELAAEVNALKNA